MLEKTAERCHPDSLECVASSCSWGNKEYGDGLCDVLALVRTDQEKARYTFLDDVDYLVEDNAMDAICLSPELDGTFGVPTFEHSCGHQNF
jgi:DNA-directed RNA polymerase-5 subunit 1